MSADLLVRGIGRLLTMTGPPDDPLGVVEEAALVIHDGAVAWTGRERDLPTGADMPSYDAGGACVAPGFVDAHTHLVWAGSRRDEFVARLAGRPYAAGGIRTTVAATRGASEHDLVDLAVMRAHAMLANGTTTVEVKTGYGLTPDHELRLLDVISVVGERTPLRIEPTYLGAHVVPDDRDRVAYVDEVVVTAAAARDRGARWCDVFCDRGAFTVEETRRILGAARDLGLGRRMHAEQLEHTGAARLAAELRCASADHLEHVTAEDARALAGADVVAVLLPGAALSTGHLDAGHVRLLRESGAAIALATDCNPGTSWCESMPYVVQLGCLLFGLDIASAFVAATRTAARALRRDDVGHLAVGACGDLVVLGVDHEADAVAHLGARTVDVTVVGGVPWLGSG